MTAAKNSGKEAAKSGGEERRRAAKRKRLRRRRQQSKKTATIELRAMINYRLLLPPEVLIKKIWLFTVGKKQVVAP